MIDYFSKIPERSAILVIGPPLSQKDKIFYEIVSKALNNKKTVLFITTDHFPKDVESSLQKNKILPEKYEKEGNLKFIDCYSAQTQNTVSDTAVIKRVPGPLALNEISVALAELENYFYKKNKKQYVFFQSLSTLLMYSTPEAVGRFVQIITARTKNVDGSIVFIIEKGMHDEKVVASMEHLMDGVVEVDGRKVKVKI
ncbi:MAG: ATPase domain-containing protein [Candidatus Woesearchaeota archaeon]